MERDPVGTKHSLAANRARFDEAILKDLDRGLLVTHMGGGQVDTVTGNFVFQVTEGFWVEGGKIAYPVHEITIAGNLRKMLLDIVAVGADAYTSGSRTIGSVLIEKMKIAGD